MKTKQLGIISMILGALNMVSVIFNSQWYLILCFIILGAGPIIYSVFLMGKDEPFATRSIAWADIIFGLSILSLAASDFYGKTNLPFIQYITSIGLIGVGAMGLYHVISNDKVDIIP